MGSLCQDAIHPKKAIQELCTCCAWGGPLDSGVFSHQQGQE